MTKIIIFGFLVQEELYQTRIYQKILIDLHILFPCSIQSIGKVEPLLLNTILDNVGLEVLLVSFIFFTKTIDDTLLQMKYVTYSVLNKTAKKKQIC